MQAPSSTTCKAEHKGKRGRVTQCYARAAHHQGIRRGQSPAIRSSRRPTSLPQGARPPTLRVAKIVHPKACH
eukprot:scaffold221578_cov23-Tisochrysis_lutea.AAC.3